MIAGILAAATGVAGQAARSSDPPEEPAAIRAPAAQRSGDEIFAELVRQNELRSALLKQYSEVRIYSLTSPDGKVHARETVRMEYASPNQKSFVTISEEGSALVRHLVLNRLIQHELSVAAGKEHQDNSIIPANYTFTLLGEEEAGGRPCFVVAAHPKRMEGYLFEGKIWIDSREFAIVKISGHPARKYSFWISRVEFLRQYEEISGFWLATKDESTVSVRLYGKKILTIEHRIEMVNGAQMTPGAERNPQPVAEAEHQKSG